MRALSSPIVDIANIPTRSHGSLQDLGADDHTLYTHGFGLASARPAAGTVGRFYYSTDTDVLERDNGTTWDEVGRGEVAMRLAQFSEKNFLSLAQVPASFSGQALKGLRVNSGENALEFSSVGALDALADTALGSAAASISASIAARAYLKVILLARFNTRETASIIVRFNADSGNNYSWRRAKNDEAEATGVSQTGGQLMTTFEDTCVIILEITNFAAVGKAGVVTVCETTGTAASAPERFRSAINWENTANQITSIEIRDSGSALVFAAGTRLIVLGSAGS